MAITYEQLQKANEATKPTDIGKGKDYIEVNQRIKAFRMLFPMGKILTELVSNEDGICIFRALVEDENGNLLGTGTAYEKENSTFINKTSYIENCETSAVGRALAMLGIGIDASVASKEEVENAKLNQNKADEPKQPRTAKKEAKPKNDKADSNEAVLEAKAKSRVIGYVNRHQFSEQDITALCRFFKKQTLQELTLADCERYIKSVESRGGNIDE